MLTWGQEALRVDVLNCKFNYGGSTPPLTLKFHYLF